ncbi:hypothetical protein [Gulosibacter sp. 10]|uniref:hypothetical protein n=1 Tax=Gulosibacter sp. 10 TaxID=1255570 RepID=UPI00097E91B8|nr:hypothetical protein [Gulosibacter sp. 10]SJM71764.1 hypothetical protein FM112_16820 [Gulosibacter sp. 10]
MGRPASPAPLAMLLRLLSDAELHPLPERSRVGLVLPDHEDDSLLVVNRCGETHSLRWRAESTVESVLATLSPSTEFIPGTRPIPVEPSIEESWALLHYDLAITWDSLAECRPRAELRRIERRGDEAILVLSDGRDELRRVEPLRGRDVLGASVDLMMQWNTERGSW